MKTTTAPGYASIPLSHILGWLTSGASYTVAYFLFMRATARSRKPCLPAISLAINIAWEIALSIITPVTPLATIVYVQWLIVDVALVYNQVKYGGLGALEFFGSLAVGGVREWCMMKTIIDAAMAAGETEEQGRFQAAFWTGYFCQLVISSWSLQQVLRGKGAQLGYGGWLGRFLGHVPVGLMTLDRARTFPEIYAYTVSPMGLFLIVTPMILDLVWLVVRWTVVQDGEERAGRVRVRVEEKKKA